MIIQFRVYHDTPAGEKEMHVGEFYADGTQDTILRAAIFNHAQQLQLLAALQAQHARTAGAHNWQAFYDEVMALAAEMAQRDGTSTGMHWNALNLVHDRWKEQEKSGR